MSTHRSNRVLVSADDCQARDGEGFCTITLREDKSALARPFCAGPIRVIELGNTNSGSTSKGGALSELFVQIAFHPGSRPLQDRFDDPTVQDLKRNKDTADLYFFVVNLPLSR